MTVNTLPINQKNITATPIQIDVIIISLDVKLLPNKNLTKYVVWKAGNNYHVATNVKAKTKGIKTK